MKTVVVGHRPEIDELLARRRERGQDGYDEVWEGIYHVAPMAGPQHAIVQAALVRVLGPLADAAGLTLLGPFNLGDSDDYRVPDAGLHRTAPTTTYVPTAALVVEVLSPEDETYDKFEFYARRGVDEIVVADPANRSVRWWRRDVRAYVEIDRSALLDVTAVQIAAAIEWPDAPASRP